MPINQEEDLLKNYLMSKYQEDPEALNRARERSERKELMGGLGSALNTISRATGAQNLSDEPYKQMAEGGQKLVGEEMSRQKMLRDYLKDKAGLGLQQKSQDLQLEQLKNTLKHQNDLIGLKKQELESDKLKTSAKLSEDAIKKETPFGIAKTEDDAKRLKESAAAYDSYTKKLDRLYQLRQEHGGELYGPVKAEMESLVKGATTDIKTMEGLGALSGSDLEIVNEQLGNISSHLVSDESVLKRLKTTRGSADEKMRSFAKAYGGSADKVITKPSYETGDGWSQAEEQRLLELEAKAKGK